MELTRRALTTVLLLLLFLQFPVPAPAQNDADEQFAAVGGFTPPYLNNRLLFVRNYDPVEYRGQNQIYDIAQDKRGVMYFGNNVYGVLEYDGIDWHTITLSNNNTAYSLATAPDGTIYVGGFDELGYIDVVNGKSVYHSLIDLLPEGTTHFGIVGSVKATDNGVYFKVGEHVLRYHAGRFARVTTGSTAGLGDLHQVRDRVYTIDTEGTIHRIDRDRMAPVFEEDPETYGDYIFRTRGADGDEAEAFTPTDLILPYGEEGLLVSSWNHGLMIVEDGLAYPFENEAEAAGLIDRNYGYGSSPLPNGEYAISTFDGIVILDQAGRLKAWINQDNGLINTAIRSIFADNQHFLWVGTSYGLSQILYPSPYSRYDQASGIFGQIRMSHATEEALFVVTSDGAFRAEPTVFDAIGMTFQPIPGIEGETGYIHPFRNTVLIANIAGLYQVVPEDAAPDAGDADPLMHTDHAGEGIVSRLFLPLSGTDCRFIEVSKTYPGIVYVGTTGDGLYILKEDRHQWQVVGQIEIDDQIFFGAEDARGSLWVSGVATGGYRIDFPGSDFGRPEITNYYTEEGLPKGWYVPSAVDDGLYLYSDEAFFRYDPAAERFRADRTFFDDTSNVGFVKEAPNGDVWITKGRPRRLMKAVRVGAGSYQLAPAPFQRFNGYQVRNFGFAENGTAWFGAGESLLSYDPGVDFNTDKPFQSVIRSVTVNDIPIWGEGSLKTAAGGTTTAKHDRPPRRITLPYDQNNLRFDFAGMYLDVAYGNQYRVYMEGLNREWPKWSESTFKEYNSLPPGQYTFHVLSRNLYGKIGKSTNFSFKIKPPWWNTLWFYAAEVSLFLTLLLVSIIMNRTGEPTRFSRTVTMVTIVIFFESIMMQIEEVGELFGGGIPLIQLSLNIAMAMVFEPAHRMVGSILLGKRMRRRRRVTFDPFGHWTGGAVIPRSLVDMRDFDRWFSNLRGEFEDIGRKYARYLSDDMLLDTAEKADLVVELEDALTGLLLLQRFVTKDQPRSLEARSSDGSVNYRAEVFPRYWEGSGLVLGSVGFAISTFIEWFGPMFEQIEAEITVFRSTMMEGEPTDGDRRKVLEVIEDAAGQMLTVIRSLLQADDREVTDADLDLERLR